MSSFLGPIHYWLYNKIRLQEDLIGCIDDYAKNAGWEEHLDPDFISDCRGEKLLPLEEVIDTSNIHGWLQGKIHSAESRYARLVTALLKEDSGRLSELCRVVRDFGQKHAISEGSDAEDAYKLLNDSLLDGMPCDHVNQVIERSPSLVRWEQTICLHSDYWEQEDGDAGIYYQLREQLIDGMLEGSGLTFSSGNDRTFEIKAA